MNKSLLLTVIIFVSCNKSEKINIESIVKKYMTDSIVPIMNDPKSFELASIKIDTFYGRDYITNVKSVATDSSFGLEFRQEYTKKLDSLSKIKGLPDSLLNYQVRVSFRGKNKWGALVVNDLKLSIDPATKSVSKLE